MSRSLELINSFNRKCVDWNQSNEWRLKTTLPDPWTREKRRRVIVTFCYWVVKIIKSIHFSLINSQFITSVCIKVIQSDLCVTSIGNAISIVNAEDVSTLTKITNHPAVECLMCMQANKVFSQRCLWPMKSSVLVKLGVNVLPTKRWQSAENDRIGCDKSVTKTNCRLKTRLQAANICYSTLNVKWKCTQLSGWLNSIKSCVLEF